MGVGKDGDRWSFLAAAAETIDGIDGSGQRRMGSMDFFCWVWVFLVAAWDGVGWGGGGDEKKPAKINRGDYSPSRPLEVETRESIGH